MDAHDTLLAIYDYSAAPITFDFFNFLMVADAERAAAGLDALHVAFVPGEDGVFFHGLGFGFDDEEKRKRVRNVLVPGASLMPSCRQVTVCPRRSDAAALLSEATYIFPAGYELTAPIGLYETSELPAAWARGLPLGTLAVPNEPKQRVAAEMAVRTGGLPLVTLTLRQSSYATYLNSNVAASAAFAAHLRSEGYHPLFIPDNEMLDRPLPPDLSGFDVFPEAAGDVLVRAAVYEIAHLNVMRNISAGQVALLNRAARSLHFIPLTSDLADEMQMAPLGSFGLPVGAQFHFLGPSHKIIWDKDSVEALTREFARFDMAPPEAPLTQRDVARHLARFDKPLQAQEILESLLPDEDDVASIEIEIAELESDRGLHVAALARLDALAVSPEREARRGDALAGLGRLEAALAAYENADRSPQIAYKQASVLIRLGRPAEALNVVEASLATDPADRTLIALATDLDLARGNPSAAEREIAILHTATDTHGILRLGDIYLRTGRSAEARTLMMERLAKQPMNWGAHACLAEALESLGDLSGALDHYKQATTHSWQRQATPLLKLARLQANLGHLAEAEENARRCTVLMPNHASPHQMLAQILMAQGRMSEALRAMTTARELELAAR